MTQLCPCDSNKRFSQCCWPYIAGKAVPPSAETLMRSRYTAYSRANIAYIEATQRGQAAARFDAAEAKQWAQAAKWLGLKVLRAEHGGAKDEAGVVEFIATYKLLGQIQEIHEVSEFQKIDGRWFYIKGQHRAE